MKAPAWRSLLAPAGFAVAVAVLLAAGRGELATPPVDRLGAWLEHAGPVTAAMAIVRLAALGAAAWMLVVTAVSAAARLAGATRLAVAADHALPPALRRALTGLAGAGAAGAALIGAAQPSTPGSAAIAPTVEHLVRLPDAAPPPEATVGSTPAAAPETATATMALVPASSEWVVEPGDSFWSIAEDVLADAFGRPPTDGEVVGYWRTVIDANRDRLVSPEPDLILPGQRFTVPAPPPPPG